MVTYPDKDPADVCDYELDWTDVLNSDTVAAIVSVTITPFTTSPLKEAVGKSSSTTATTTVIWLEGGYPGVTYIIAVKITTAGGRTLERSAILAVAQR